ncbi:MAG TPA: gamma-glutamyltransferase [Steroidobacteraceae bacterium]|jgi:gamma-glutamyltranspeptidase/glutathione hydrolase|nr:gamma-glutamyltransferase [Steroidobacteraceae bacterium]
MAATSQPLVSQVALDVLKRGGTAVDAAIAANATMGLMEPTGNGVGGDLFAIVWDARTKKLYGLNGSGRSPRSLTLETLRAELHKLNSPTIPRTGPLPVSVPGAVDGWFELHARFGRLPMKELLQPAIAYARNGFPVTEVIADGWARNARVLAKYPGFAETYMPNGRAPAKGEIFRNPNLANTLSAIAAGGRDAFYKGDIAARIDSYMRANGGYLTAADLASHHSEWVEPVSTNYRGYDVWELPPNAQGVAALQMLNILEAYDLKSMGFGSADYLHVLIEAKKLAFEDRARYYADPEFTKIPLAGLLSKTYAAKRRALISMDKAALEYPDDPRALEQGDTIYMTVADSAGNMVSLIQSNYRGMGSGMTPTGCGFILQDRGELFSLDAGHANVYAPGKRPFQTIIPAFVTRDGKPWLSFGVMGGAMQPQGHVQILVNLIDFGMNLQEAGDAPRARHDGSSEPTGERMHDGGQVVLEVGATPATVKALEARGHKVTVSNDGDFGGYQAILRNAEGVYFGASESRKDGAAQGY